jgi:DNA-binding winged helix-turn-helix (wHTH) protein
VPSSTMPASIEPSPLLRFGVFELDRQNRELRKQGRRIRLQEQPFQVLAYLLERAGQAVTRDELRERLWPASVYVDFDHGLNNAIARLREALGDTATAPQYIETLPRLGYRFIHPVVNPQAAAGTPVRDNPIAAGPGSGAAVPPPAD